MIVAIRIAAVKTNNMGEKCMSTLRLKVCASLVLSILVLLSSFPVEARERGTPGSDERFLWCYGQRVSCIDSGNKACDTKYPSDIVKAKACYDGVTTACTLAFGTGATDSCMTTVKVRPFMGTVPPLTAPVERGPEPALGVAPNPDGLPQARSSESVGPGMSDNTDRAGSDYRSFDLTNPGECQLACNQQRTCRAWTYVRPGVQGSNAKCHLKNAVPPATPNACCISGVKGPGVVRDHREEFRGE
jgi:hypothetical protein